MNKIITFLKNLITFDFNRVSLIKAEQRQINLKGITAFLFIFLFLALTRPQFMSLVSVKTVFLMSFLTAFIYSFIGWLYYSFLMKKIILEKWTFKKDFKHFLNIIIISTTFYLIYSYFGFNYLYKDELLFQGWNLFYTYYIWLFFCILFLSTLIFVFFKFMDYYKFLIYEHKIPEAKEEINIENNFLSLVGKNKDENVKVNIDDFIYLESFGHYAKAYLRIENNEIKIVVFRNSINKVIHEMEVHEELFQCHRSYIVNINNVTNIEGNSKKAFLNIKQCNSIIPLSRESYAELKKKKLSFENLN